LFGHLHFSGGANFTFAFVIAGAAAARGHLHFSVFSRLGAGFTRSRSSENGRWHGPYYEVHSRCNLKRKNCI